MKNWRDGIAGKEYGRFEGYGDTPPEKNGDYAWLMHILKALKSNGKAAVILPHGVLFRGNAEATIREAIIKKHWIKGIISLPANLFYGTGIAACVLVIDKEGAANRQGIFMIDASRGYVKDGNKNRLRERDIYRIITTFNEQITTDPKYARFVPNDEIEKKNGYNLNITRYIDSTDPEDIQDIYAHIHGGIPAVDIDSLSKYWDVFPSLKAELLKAISDKYYSLNVEHENIRQTIYKNAEFSEYGEKLDEAFAAWKAKEYPTLSSLDEDVSARELIISLAEDILAEFEHLTLIDKYDVYQVMLAYWNEVMNDDVSLIISEPDGYANARATDNIEEEITQGKNKGEMKVTGWEGRLIPKAIVIDTFFREEKNAIEEAENVVAETESLLSDLVESADEESALADVAENGKVKAKDLEAKIEELTQHVETEETIELELLMDQLPMQKKRLQAYLVGHPLCESAVTEKGTVTKSSIMLRLFIIRTVESVPESLQDDVNQLRQALDLCGKVSDYNKIVKDLNKALDEKCRARYDIPMATNQGFKNVVPFKDTCIKYLYYLLQTKKREMLEKATASTFAEISKSALCEIPLQAPEKQEQEQIAQVLFDIDALITDLQKLIQKKKNIRQGTMQMLVTGKKRLDGFSGEWVKINLAKNSRLKARIGWQGLTTAEYLDEGYSYLINLLEEITLLIEALVEQQERMVFSEAEDTLTARLQHQLLKLRNILKAQNQMLTQEKEQIKTLISDISHQIKTPVAAANTFAQLLGDTGLSDEERSEYIATLQMSLEKLTFLTNSLIKMSRLESGIIRLKPEQNSLNDIVMQAVKTVYAKARDKNITITFDCGQTFEALLDFNWTAEAVTNVLDNAVKYTPSGGVVDLKITEYPSYLRLDVSDNGIGIPEEEQAKIFGRFYRGKQSAGVDGVGIGLYLTRDIVNKQNGYIKVASDEKGTTFSLFLKKFREQ